MTDHAPALFLAAPPGLESALLREAEEAGFAQCRAVPGGVEAMGGWPEVWRANLVLRCASRVLFRVASFPAAHLAQLDKRARKLPWAELLHPGEPVKVEAHCKRSKIYHQGAAAQRIEGALRDCAAATICADAAVKVMARIDRNICEISVDASGEPLHRRGFKQAVGKAPMRETLAAAFLRECGYDGAEPVVDPMCGSGTFVIEAAEIAAGLRPGRGRAFAFERLASFDSGAWEAMKAENAARPTEHLFHGFDRDPGAVSMSAANAQRAGVDAVTRFHKAPVSALRPPEGPKGLVIVNPPYGERIGDPKALYALYGSLGKTLRERFVGWRVGLITSEPRLAHSTGLKFLKPGPPVPHGPLRIQLFRTAPLKGA